MALVVTIAIDRRHRTHRARAFYALARDAKMNYSPLDRFDLAGRLRQMPHWVAETTDLHIRDVLYAARGQERRFVATAVVRHTRDVRPTLYVIACVEGVNDHLIHETRPRLAVKATDVIDVYQKATEN